MLIIGETPYGVFFYSFICHLSFVSWFRSIVISNRNETLEIALTPISFSLSPPLSPPRPPLKGGGQWNKCFVDRGVGGMERGRV